MTTTPPHRSFRKSIVITWWRVAGVLGAALLGACSEKAADSGPSAVDVLVDGIVEQQILVDVSRFRDEAETLDEATTEFCTSPSDDGLTAARTQWQRTAEAWYRLQLFNFGPADADPVFPLFTFIDPLRLRGMDYTETVRSDQAAWRNSDVPLDEPFFAELRFNDLGLLALEVALYDGQDLFAVYQSEPRRCDILRGLSIDLHARASALHEGWTEGYEDSDTPFVTLLRTATLPNGRYPLAQIIVSAQAYVDYLHQRHVIRVAGQLSNTSWQLLAAALDAVEQLLMGEIEGGNVVYWMEALGGPAPVQAVQGDLQAARTALREQDVEALESALAALDGDFKRDIPDALEVELGLTFTDGD